MNTEEITYSGFVLHKARVENVKDVLEYQNGYSRVEIPSDPFNFYAMHKMGFVFSDRTLGVEINLKRSRVDYDRLVRFDVSKSVGDKKKILEIALKSFLSDSRFNVSPKQDEAVARVIIRKWVEELNNIYVCRHKDNIAGFLDIESFGTRDCFIHMAAVEERYRAAGAAVSLYAAVILEARENGYEKVYGRISSANTAVMNLYTLLGASFYDPLDVFVKDGSL